MGRVKGADDSRGLSVKHGLKKEKSKNSGFVCGNQTASHSRNSKGVGERSKCHRAQLGGVAICWTWDLHSAVCPSVGAKADD